MGHASDPPRGVAGAAAAPWIALALAACSGGDEAYVGTTARTGKDAATFYVNNGDEPETLDPARAVDSVSIALLQQMFEGLTTYAPGDLHPVQGVATRWEQSDDNRIFRFHLRPEARWSDGKPVTAHDFEYAWKRVLRPRTASLAATNLHVLKNGELFNLGKLKALREAAPLRAAPRPDAPPALELPRGAFVVVLARSPARTIAAVAPLAAPPPGVTAVAYAAPDEETGAGERLSFEAAPGAAPAPAPVAPAPGSGWRGASVSLLAAGPPVACNGAADRWFEVEGPAGRGFLPGCLLEPAEDAAYALVAPHASLPTYDPSRPQAAPPQAAATGFIAASALVEDDGAVGVRARDERTLDVELEQPTPYFLDLTSSVTLFPVRRDVVEPFEARGEPGLWFRPESIVVNGPYTLDAWKFRYEITMKRNPAYWARDALRIHRIVWMEIPQYNAAMQLYRAGDLDYLGDNTSLPSEHLGWLSGKKDFRRSEYLSTVYYELNTRRPPLDDARVRWALNLAIDKRTLVEKITRTGTPATHYVPDITGSGYAEQVAEDRRRGADPFARAEVGHDPARARALLAEAGYEIVREGDGLRARGFPPIEVLYNTGEGHGQVAVAIQDMWKRHLGISVTLRNEEWRVMLDNLSSGNFQVIRLAWYADYNHPHTWLGTFLSYSSQNRSGWADAEFDEMVRKAAAVADPAESIRLYRAAERRALDGMCRIPLYFEEKPTLVKPWVRGFLPNARNTQLMRWLWIDPDWQSKPAGAPPPAPELPPPGRLGGP
ncbi:peptide ABC transporter substrate-binding protein [Sorangium cellulosum]|uniref:Peptide ABC transporter substrate-binding protein n=1 Tax=Sorangium cellulosum TaxID=56 RepID=A0A4P2Q0D8_SORCE|nr:peptide ABC transporter substrate-binding protein [Sorangium cellulosum]AUX22639.1 peptide ABC transporter substrate-binding protein [Sorangium cellulosum]